MLGLLSAWRDRQERRRILRELNKEQQATEIRARLDVKDKLTLALEVIGRGDEHLGAEMWEKALELYPREANASPLKFRILFGLRRFDEAEALMIEGRRASPGNSDFIAGLIEIAGARGDQETLLKLCAEARARFPRLAISYVRALWALINRGRLDEAEVIARKAMKLLPDEIMVFEPFAAVAMKREDWEEALKRWQMILDRFEAQNQSPYVSAAQVLVRLRRFDEAEALLEPWLSRLGSDLSCRLELARIAQGKGDTELAIRRWRHLATTATLNLEARVQAADELMSVGDLAGAETILREAVEQAVARSR
jgi:tetratricopeptide (TPR) repeat protein